MSSGPYGTAQLGVQRLDRVGRVDDPPHAFREREKRYHELPVAPPALRDCRMFYAPWTLREGLKGSLASGEISYPIDGPQRLRHAFAIFPGGKVHRMTDQVGNAGLHDGVRNKAIYIALGVLPDGAWLHYRAECQE